MKRAAESSVGTFVMQHPQVFVNRIREMVSELRRTPVFDDDFSVIVDRKMLCIKFTEAYLEYVDDEFRLSPCVRALVDSELSTSDLFKAYSKFTAMIAGY